MPHVLRFNDENEQGFTLIELLVVILIIGILAAIAIPFFLNQRKAAVDAAVQSDITNAGRLLAPEVLKGKSLERTVTVTQDSLPTAGTSTQFDMASIRVSEGTTLIIQPSQIEGGVCIYGVNPGGDVAARSPGFIFDSFKGGLLRQGATLSPGACTSLTGSLIIPVPEIERALNPGSGPIASDPPAVQPEVITLSGKLSDRSYRCLAGEFTLTLTYSEETLYWSVTGLERIELWEGLFSIAEMDKATGNWVRSHIITIDDEVIESGTYSGSFPAPSPNGNTVVIDDVETVFYGDYKEYTVGDMDWSSNPITRACSSS